MSEDEEGNEERWRALAKEALVLSQRLSDPTAQRVMLRIAEAYDSLADRAKLLRERDQKPHKS
jgi:hypothetical protein